MSNLFHAESNMELVYEEKEILHSLREFLLVVEEEILGLRGGFDTFEGCCNLWVQNMLSYAKEAYNSIEVGNFISLAMMARCMLENCVCGVYIHRFEEQRLWEKWFISSAIARQTEACNLTSNTDVQRRLEESVKVLYEERGVIDWEVKNKYGWTAPVVGKKQPNFRELCEFSDLFDPYVYKDFRRLCDYCHGTQAFGKIYRFTFVNTYLYLIFVLVRYFQLSVEEMRRGYLSERYLMSKERLAKVLNKRMELSV
ncbi:hypothetical protein M2150_000980 [Lachnospiraceae bacterium PM6-15]|uniref:DUF5677 domain-containing protein n=1 Tax=Ohessyouella blattaphilus TaxID=2949333 RepID=UPI003E221EAA